MERVVEMGIAELHAWSGPHRQVAMSLYALPSDVVLRPYHVLLLEGAGRAEVRTVTRVSGPGDGLGAVHVWEGPSLGELPALLSDLLMRDEARPEDVEDVLRKHGEFADLGVVPRPVTARGSFGHPVKTFPSDAVLRAIVLAV